MTGPAPTTVLAAGALVWRPGTGGGLEVLLVHSRRYDEWTWPKGKPEGDEVLPVTALREVAEESGVTVRLGRPLPGIEYDLPDGRHKAVTYWAAQPVAEGPRTAAEAEIDDAVWLPAATARERLTRRSDAALLDLLVDLADRDELDSSVLVAVRHAKSAARRTWTGDDEDRPLNAEGQAQARRLVPLLLCWRPQRIVTSPWLRCQDTVLPYAGAAQLPLLEEPALSEAAAARDPAEPADVVRAQLGARDDVLLCTHRKALPAVVGVLREAAAPDVRADLPRTGPWLAKGELLVCHVTKNGGSTSIDAVERFRTH